MHKVTRPETVELSCVPCRANPMRLICTCKGSRKIGVCSHVIAVNARCKAYSIQRELMKMQKAGSKKRRQATGRRQMQPASSDSEASDVDDDLANHESSSEGDE